MEYEKKLIEGKFPCRVVGAETQRERGASSSLPPLYFLHVWWARRPLTPSRAALLGSILPADTDAATFLSDLGIFKKQVRIDGQPWTLTGKVLELVEESDGKEFIPYSAKFQKAVEAESRRRTAVRNRIQEICVSIPELSKNLILQKWAFDNQPFNINAVTARTDVFAVPADPAGTNDRISLVSSPDITKLFGEAIRLDPEDSYGYGRAYEASAPNVGAGITVLDPTAGGGSIPFEAARIGCNVVANDLNPVATIIEKATIEYPQKYGKSLLCDLSKYGTMLEKTVNEKTASYYHFAMPDEKTLAELERVCGQDKNLLDRLVKPEIDQQGLLYCREVTCPHCRNRVPLLNSFALQKKADGWMVVPEIVNNGDQKQVRLVPVRLHGGKGPHGENPEDGSVNHGTGTCLICNQAIESEEIKRQARGESEYGAWSDRLYCVVAIREQPKLDKAGKIKTYATGPQKGQPVMGKEQFFREPTEQDFVALDRAKEALEQNWSRWDDLGLIPTERIPEGNDMRPINYGMRRWCDMGLIPTERIPDGHKTLELHNVGVDRWCDMFTSRQLVAALTAMETLREMSRSIIDAEGEEKAKAIITYLQFMIDKLVDYNSRQTRWEYTRSVIKGTFGRHDFSLKWTFGEMIVTGPASGLAWGVSQVVDAYKGICELLPAKSNATVQILNGSAANMELADQSVPVICVDPPYYNNVQYAELSDFYYVWDKRSLKQYYPELFTRRLTNKNDEAVANPVRDGSAKESERRYESMMGDIFRECRRVMRDDGIMVMMFTHKTQEAWETLTKALIETGWEITSTFPVDSEASASMHQKDQAAAASSIFISCRKREMEDKTPAVWQSFGGGIVQQLRGAVRDGLESYKDMNLNAVDEMVASYGCALRVLSENWPVMDGDDLVTPIKAMREASTIVAQYQMEKISNGRLGVQDVDAEAAVAMTLFGVYGLGSFPYDDALSLSKSLNINLANKAGGYKTDGQSIGINPERTSSSVKSAEKEGFYAPLVSKGSKLRLAKPEERNKKRLDAPQTEWDVMHGLIMAYREGDIPVARA